MKRLALLNIRRHIRHESGANIASLGYVPSFSEAEVAHELVQHANGVVAEEVPVEGRAGG